MTDNEIFETEIKCINRRANGQCNGGTDCCNCDLLMNEKDIISAYERAMANFDLINRQQEEIERLTTAYPKTLESIKKIYATAKSEAVKEFAEAYKDQVKNYTGMFTDDGFYVSLDAVLNAVDFVCERLSEEMG